MGILDDLEREQKRIEEKRQRILEENRERNDWHKHLRRSKGDRLLGDGRNVELALIHAPELKGLVRFNELSARVVFTRNPPWSERDRIADYWNDDDSCGLLTWLQGVDVPITSSTLAADVVHMHAREHHHFHPVREWLSSLQWDGQPRIADVLIKVLAVGENLAYARIVLRKFMISAVARAMRPGCKADHMLVLVSAQGLSKSSFAQVLGAPWTIEGLSTFGSKDSMSEIREAWILESPELSGMRRSEIESTKSFVSRLVDHYRPAYGRTVINQPRGCVLIGTTNEVRFLLDTTGNRRFWPVKCGSYVDLSLLQSLREQLWAEAVAAYHGREQWWLTKEEEALASDVQEQHRIVTSLEQDVREYLERRVQTHLLSEPLIVTPKEVYCAICGPRDVDDLAKLRAVEMQIGAAIRKCEWTSIGRHGKGRNAGYQAPIPKVNT